MEADAAKKLDEILSRYGREEGDLIPILQEAQEAFGYLSQEVMKKIAKYLRLADSTVFGVSTFYSQFKFIPTGRKLVKVCRGTACHVRGGARILREVENRLGIRPGETSSDLSYSLESIACFGSCALGPVIVVNQDVYGRMTTAKVEQILSENK